MVQRVERRPANMFKVGQGKAQPHKFPKSKVWAKHDVDQHPTYHKTRNATRAACNTWAGTYLVCTKWKAAQFLRGKGLSKSQKRCRIEIIRGDGPRTVGYTDDLQYALGWVRAARDADWDTPFYIED